MSLLVVILVMLVALLLEGFFSGSELALVSADKVRLANKVEKGSQRAKFAQWLIKNPTHLFATTLLGTNMFAIIGATVLSFYIISNFGEEYSSFAMLYSVIILVFGEIVPKSVFQHHADVLAPRVAPFLIFFSYMFYPIVWFFKQLAKLMVRGLKKTVGGEHTISRDELELIITGTDMAGSDVKPAEQKKISSILRLATQKVKSVMVPLAEVEAVPITMELEAVSQIFALKGYSMLPVFDHRMFNVVGLIEDFDVMLAAKDQQIRDLMREPVFVPEEMTLSRLFVLLKNKRQKIAIVVDEFGGATGLVTMEDVIEEVVGDIQDEFELGKQYYRVLGPGRYLVNGRMEIKMANDKLLLNIPVGNYETIAGLIIHTLQYLPKKGEIVRVGEFTYKVYRATPKSILEVEVFK